MGPIDNNDKLDDALGAIDHFLGQQSEPPKVSSGIGSTGERNFIHFIKQKASTTEDESARLRLEWESELRSIEQEPAPLKQVEQLLPMEDFADEDDCETMSVPITQTAPEGVCGWEDVKVDNWLSLLEDEDLLLDAYLPTGMTRMPAKPSTDTAIIAEQQPQGDDGIEDLDQPDHEDQDDEDEDCADLDALDEAMRLMVAAMSSSARFAGVFSPQKEVQQQREHRPEDDLVRGFDEHEDEEQESR